MHQTVVNLLLEVDTPSRKRLSKKIMEELKCYGVEFKKKSDDVPHVSLDEISHSKKADQNEGVGAQWAY